MKPSITVVALGPGSPDYLTLKAAELLTDPGYALFLRTERHPCAAWLDLKGVPFATLDRFYDQYEDFDEMYVAMAGFLCEEAGKKDLLYAVPDLTDDLSVRALSLLSGKQGIRMAFCPGVSYPDLYLPGCPEADPSRSFCVVPASGIRNCPSDPSQSLLITELNDRITAGEVKLFLTASCVPDETEVTFMTLPQNGGQPVLKRILLCELDRQTQTNHTSAVLIPGSDYRQRDYFSVRDLELIMDRLRAQDGCPWDRMQTHESLRPYIVEEAWEAVSAINDGDTDHLADELGDVLLQIVFHASIGKTFEEFSMSDIAGNICRKMLRRHPHIFGSEKAGNAEEVTAVWEKAKRAETGSATVGESLSDVSASLPSLKYAIKVLKKAVQLPAMKQDPAEILAGIRSLAGSLTVTDGRIDEAGMGELLMKCTELCQRCGADAENLLHETVDRFIQRFQKAEKRIFLDGKSPESLTFNELCVYFKYVEER